MALDRVLLLDPELGNPGGHYANYMEAIREACERAGLGFATAGWRGGVSDYPVFDRMHEKFVPRSIGGDLVNPLLGRVRMRRQLREGLREAMTPGTLAFAATANHRHFGALGDWMDAINGPAPSLAVLVRFPLIDPVRGRRLPTAALARQGLRRLHKAAQGRLRLVADSEELAAEYREATGLDVAYVPIPHMVPEAILEAGAIRRAGRPRIGYFGESREEKGFGLMMEAAEALGGESGMEFVVQRYVRNGYETGGAGWAARGSERVRILEGVLDREEYYREFLACDAVVLPYRLDRYAARNSGILTDALAVGIPVLTTRGSWMEKQVDRFGAGHSAEFACGKELAGVLRGMVSDLNALRRKAEQRAEAWKRVHSADAFLRGLLACFEGGA